MIAAHSEQRGTEHRGRMIGTMHALPSWQTPTQEAMNLPHAAHVERVPGGPPCTCPDCMEGPTYAHRPDPLHIVYDAGHIVARIKPSRYPTEDGRWPCIERAREIVGRRKLAARAEGRSPYEVTFDAWVPGNVIAARWTQPHDDEPITKTVFRESAEAAGYVYDDDAAGRI